MKHILLYSFLVVILLQSYSQSLEIRYEGERLSAGDELTMTVHTDSGLTSFDGLEVMNLGSSPLNIKCAREVLNQVSNAENSFCWGGCYSNNTDTSDVAVRIDGGGVSTEFTAAYSPAENSGETRVKYTFYDRANPDDQINFIINYKGSTALGIGDYGHFFSPMYPNPANNEAKLDFALPSTMGRINFVLFDLLGSKVKEIEISEKTGSLRLNTSGLTEGIYFYSLLIDDESFLTQKLIIKH